MIRGYFNRTLSPQRVNTYICAAFMAVLASVTDLALAVFSALVVITPANEISHPFSIETHPVQNGKDLMRVTVTGSLKGGQTAWLIVCKQSRQPDQQNFRAAIWNHGPENDEIISIRQLHPTQPHAAATGEQRQADITAVLTSAEMKRSYIYIDYPREVRDGGYYYSVDLAYYLPGDSGKKSLIQWE